MEKRCMHREITHPAAVHAVVASNVKQAKELLASWERAEENSLLLRRTSKKPRSIYLRKIEESFRSVCLF